MSEALEFLARAGAIGIGATLVLDIFGLVQARLFRTQRPDYGLVGRWIGNFPKGRFIHESIAKAAPVSGELWIGWTAHYAIGIAFAAITVAIWGLDWARDPTFAPALVVGVLGVAAPFLIMQPGMGLGIAASRAPHPARARLRSLTAHTVFGVGLYLAARLTAML